MNEDYSKTPLAGAGLLNSKDSEEMTWTEKVRLVEQELMGNPARSDKLIADTLRVVSKATVYRIREAMLAEERIKYVPLAQRISVNGRLASNNHADEHRNHNGNRFFVRPGKTVIDMCREAMAKEEAGMSSPDAAKLMGVGEKSYREVKAVVMLSDLTDLSEVDMAAVVDAIKEINDTRRSSFAFKRLGHLVERVWGPDVGKRDLKSAKKKHATFIRSMTILTDTCGSAAEMQIPYISDDEKLNALKQIDEARSSLGRLRVKILEGRVK